jgi:hypothetical protein
MSVLWARRIRMAGALVAAFGGAVAGTVDANPLADHFERIELQRTDDRPGVAAVVVDASSDAAWVDFGIGGLYAEDEWYSVPTEDIDVVLARKNKQVEYIVEQRLVTYLNVSGEGPHVSVDVEATSDWMELTQLAPGRFQMRTVEPPALALTPAQIVEIIRRQEPDWVDFAEQCTGVNEGPCYTVTDQEFRISLKASDRKQVIGTFRIYQPNGC